jgi:hypothetical protein
MKAMFMEASAKIQRGRKERAGGTKKQRAE